MAEVAGKDPTVVAPLDEDLEVLQPENQFVEIDNEKIYVKAFTFGRMLKALRHINNMVETFDETITVERNILRAFAEHEEDVLGLLTLSTGLPEIYFQEIPSDKGMDLAIMTYKVNESFFVQKILPKLQLLFPSNSPEMEAPEEKKPQAKSKKAGSTSSKI